MERPIRRTRQVGYALLGLAGAALLVAVGGVVASGDGLGTSEVRQDDIARDYCSAAAQSAFIARDVTLSTEERTARLAELSKVIDELAPPDLRKAQVRLAELVASVSGSGPTVEQAQELERASQEVRELTRSFCGLEGPGSFLDVEG